VSHDAFGLELPSRAEHLGTARSFAAAVARHYAVSGEAVEDLKIAVSEACVDALVAGEPIHLRVEDEGNSIAFAVDAPEVGEEAPDRAALDELGAPARIELIRSLFPDTTMAGAGARRAIRFSLPYG
jgi:anti-sigma regulatory factor (Ser/Thr protein kinase)